MKIPTTVAEAQQIADIVNQTGRESGEIIVVEVCENCDTIYFGQPQDRAMRKSRQVPTLCQACRKESLKSRRRKPGTPPRKKLIKTGNLGIDVYQ